MGFLGSHVAPRTKQDLASVTSVKIDAKRNGKRLDTMVRATAPLILLVWSFVVSCEWVQAAAAEVVVVGSINADTFLPVSRLPVEGENLTLRKGSEPVVDVPGGKGCTQAVAASKLLFDDNDKNRDRRVVAFVGQFGNDGAATILKQSLVDANVDLSHCSTHQDLPSGRGYVFITDSGSVSAVVSGGSNAGGWKAWTTKEDSEASLSPEYLDTLLENTKCVMLQREIPEHVNLRIAAEAKERGGILVMQDVGGEDRPMTTDMMSLCDYLVPNESELDRLLVSLGVSFDDGNDSYDDDDAAVVEKAKALQRHGANNVLVTQGSRGSTLVTTDGTVLHQPAHTLDPDHVVDETGAGDCFRAAFAVALLEGRSLPECLAFASAAGACAVTKEGAVPCTPTRDAVESRLKSAARNEQVVSSIPRGGKAVDDFPFLFGSRLNSMKDRPELWPHPLKDPRDYVARQATIEGLTCVDFNYPQHFHSWSVEEAKAALDEAGLVAGAVCLRYPSVFMRGAMNHPDESLRREAIELTKQAAVVARGLGCDEVVVWSAYDGYDYPFQVDYDAKWAQLVEAFRECCDAFPDIKFSIEYKPTDENTRFFTVPSTGAAILLVREIDRRNMGLTLDVGHMLMSGENPGQSIAMAGDKLFGVQLNDGYTRLAAEDGMMFGSVHPSMALEILFQLKRVGFRGHFYFDTFPQRSDPVKEAEFNIRRVKKLWGVVERMDLQRVQRIMDEHDAIGALELAEESWSA